MCSWHGGALPEPATAFLLCRTPAHAPCILHAKCAAPQEGGLAPECSPFTSLGALLPARLATPLEQVHVPCSDCLAQLDSAPHLMRSHAGTKIIATVGPSCQSVQELYNMLVAGASGARVDLTWGPLEYHKRSLKNLEVRVLFCCQTAAPRESHGSSAPGLALSWKGDCKCSATVRPPCSVLRAS